MAKMRLTGDLKEFSTNSGFAKILGIRVVSQSGDGMFQAGLASLFIFRPEAMTDARGVALALVVMLLPYSLIGPFVGPFLDHLRRQRILWWGNIARAFLVIVIAICMATIGVSAPVYVLALISLGLSRFMLAGLSAALPRVIRDPAQLVAANSLVPTVGGIANGIGIACGFLLRLFLPAGLAQDVTSLGIAIALYIAAAFVALTFKRDDLGPDLEALSSASLLEQLRQSGRDLVSAVRYLVRRARPAGALATMTANRFVYGLELVSIILIARNLLAEPTDADKGLEYFGFLFGMLALGYFASVFITPIAHEKIKPSLWIVVCLIGGSIGQILVAIRPQPVLLAVGLFIFGVGAQGAKIAVDSIVQADTADEYRGRAFSLYDVLFNVAECAAALLCIAVLPPDGFSTTVQLVFVVFIWLVAGAWWLLARSLADRPRP